ncbi:hypothetical protein J2Y03_003416 [Neobacillus niacini]|nr:hypothetical protein [Neobacillus niacini]
MVFITLMMTISPPNNRGNGLHFSETKQNGLTIDGQPFPL